MQFVTEDEMNNDLFRTERNKKLKQGDIVYYVQSCNYKTHHSIVNFGVVEGLYSDGINLQLYYPNSKRFVNDIPESDFVTPTHWQKLPKGWTWDTKLLRVTYKHKGNSAVNIKNKNNIQALIDNKEYVKGDTIDPSTFYCEIDRHKGYRIVRKFDQFMYSQKPNNIVLPYHKVYISFEEAQTVIEEYENDLMKQANMTDYEWSLKQIENVLDTSVVREDKDWYMNYFKSLKNFENVEVREFCGEIQWKYWKNKKWLTVIKAI